MMFFIISLVICVLLYYYWCIQTRDYWLKKGVPYVKPVPLFGSSLPFVRGVENYTNMLNKVYKSLSREPFGGYFEMREPILMVREPKLITFIAIKDFSHFTDRAVDFIFRYDKKLNPLSSHLFVVKGEKWRILRQRLSPVFTSGKLCGMLSQVNYCVSNLDKVLNESCGDGHHPGHIEARRLCIDYTIDVIGSCAFGIDCCALTNPNVEFGRMGTRAFLENPFGLRVLLLTINPRLLNILKVQDLPKDVSNFFFNVIMDAMKYRTENNIERKDFLQMMIDIMKEGRSTFKNAAIPDDEEFDEIDVAANAFVFLAAGFETTASTMSFCLYEMALNPDVQEKMFAEVMKVKEKHNGCLNMEALKDLTYMEMAISETLRKYPPVPAMFRICTKDYVIPETNVTIEKGTKVIIPMQAIFMDQKYYDKPHKFDPERFSPENKALRQSGTYFPFGDGPRYCIGNRFALMTSKLAIADIISKYKISTYEKTQIPLKLRPGSPLLTPVDGIWLKVEKRI